MESRSEGDGVTGDGYLEVMAVACRSGGGDACLFVHARHPMDVTHRFGVARRVYRRRHALLWFHRLRRLDLDRVGPLLIQFIEPVAFCFTFIGFIFVRMVVYGWCGGAVVGWWGGAAAMRRGFNFWGYAIMSDSSGRAVRCITRAE